MTRAVLLDGAVTWARAVCPCGRSLRVTLGEQARCRCGRRWAFVPPRVVPVQGESA
jgi:hypothetical protein